MCQGSAWKEWRKIADGVPLGLGPVLRRVVCTILTVAEQASAWGKKRRPS